VDFERRAGLSASAITQRASALQMEAKRAGGQAHKLQNLQGMATRELQAYERDKDPAHLFRVIDILQCLIGTTAAVAEHAAAQIPLAVQSAAVEQAGAAAMAHGPKPTPMGHARGSLGRIPAAGHLAGGVTSGSARQDHGHVVGQAASAVRQAVHHVNQTVQFVEHAMAQAAQHLHEQARAAGSSPITQTARPGGPGPVATRPPSGPPAGPHGASGLGAGGSGRLSGRGAR
jgi:hypothetical protein